MAMREKKLGRILSVKFGIGGYQQSCIGIHLTLGDDRLTVCDSKSGWDANLIESDEHAKWTEQDRSEQYDKILRFVSDLLNDAKVKNVGDLKGIPVEMEFDSNALVSWRILKEVL